MSEKNPIGNIPIDTPLLHKMALALDSVYMNMTDDEIRQLNNEIKSVTDKNCSSCIKDIADMYEYKVNAYVKRYLT